MKYLIVCLISISRLSVLNGTAEKLDWFEIGKTWHYRSGNAFDGMSQYGRMTITSDTTLHGQTAYVFETYRYQYGSTDSILHSINYAYASGDQVYYLRDNEWIVLYDFDMNVGDTLQIKAPLEKDGDQIVNLCELRDQEDYYYVVLEDQDSINIDGTNFERLTYRPVEGGCEGYSYNYNEVIWGIGPRDFFFPYDELACDDYCMPWLRCVTTDTDFIMFGDVDCDAFQIVTSEDVPWFAKDKSWYYRSGYGPDQYKDYAKMVVVGDTIIDGRLAHTLDTYSYQYQVPDSTLIRRDYAYAEGQQVYHWDGDAWVLIIDFDMEVSEVMTIPIQADSSCPSGEVQLKVTQKDFFTSGNIRLPRLTMVPANDACSSYSENEWTVIWGMGKADYFFPYALSSCEDYCMPILRCVVSDEVYYNFGPVDCDEFQLGSSTPEDPDEVATQELSLYPNPAIAGQKLFLKSDQVSNAPTEITIFSRDGRSIHRMRTDQSFFELPPLAAGVYFVQIDSQSHQTSVHRLLIID